LGLVLERFDEYPFRWGDKVIVFKKGKPVYGLPHEVEDYLFHLGYFHCIYDKYDLPYLDEKDNVYKVLDFEGNEKVAEVQDWAAIVKCKYLQTEFGAPLCTFGGGNRKTCTACLTKECQCRYPNASGAHVLKGKRWVVLNDSSKV